MLYFDTLFWFDKEHSRAERFINASRRLINPFLSFLCPRFELPYRLDGNEVGQAPLRFHQ